MSKLTRREVLATGLAVGASALAGRLPRVFAQESRPIRIGVILSYSGVYARPGNEMTRGMELVLDQVGWQAGGRRIELITEDEEADAAVAVRKARKLVESDGVDILAGVTLTPSAYALRDYVHEQQVPLVITNAAANGVTRGDNKSPFLFRASASAWQLAYPFGEWVAQNVSKRVLLLAADYGFGKESLDAFKETYLPAGGQVVDEIYTPLGSPDFSSFMTRISALRPEAVFAVLSGSDAVIFMRQFVQFGLNRTIRLSVSGETVDETVLEAIGPAAVGALSANHWVFDLDLPANQRFQQQYREKYNAIPNHFAVRGYGTMQVIVEAINAVQGDLSDKMRFVRALENVSVESPRGRLEFDPATHQAIENMYVREVKQTDEGLINTYVASLGRIRDRDEA